LRKQKLQQQSLRKKEKRPLFYFRIKRPDRLSLFYLQCNVSIAFSPLAHGHE